MGILPEFLGGTPECQYANVVFGGEIQIDALMFPDEEIRYSKTGAAKLAGLDPSYLLQIDKRQSKPLKTLQGMGFNGLTRTGKIARSGKRGASQVETISSSDLDIFIRFAAEHLKKPKAIALLGASFSEVRRDRERSAFGLAPETTEEKECQFLLEFELVSNARSELHQMNLDDTYNAPHDPGWQGSNPDNDRPVYRNPFD